MADHALTVTIPAPMMERAVGLALGDGFVAGTVVREVSMPMADAVPVGLTVTVLGARFDLHARDDARIPVRVHGRVSLGRPDGGPLPMKLPPLEVEVHAVVGVQVDVGVDQVRLLVDLPGVEFRGADVIGVGGAAPGDPLAQIATMALAETGDTLFASLGEEVGPVGIDLTGLPVAELGLAPGRAEIRCAEGALTVSFGGEAGTHGSSHRTLARTDRIGVSVDADLLGPVLAYLGTRVLGGVPAPFDLQLESAPGTLSVGVRNARILRPPVPDLRTALRAALHLNRRNDYLEVRLAGAWLELPGPLGVLNGLGRVASTLGASMVPISFRLPLVYPLDVPDADDLAIRVATLAVGADRIDAQLEFVDHEGRP